MDTATGDRPASPGGRSRVRRAARRALVAVVGAAAALTAGLVVLLAVTPPVGDAEARVQARMRAVRSDPGGATIDQQLAKMLYTPGRDGFTVKAEQVALALKLDHAYPKRRILAMYLDVAYFGHGFYGAYAASEGYFGVPPGDLDWGQAALLAGLLQQPTADDPLVHPDRARARRRHVLARLVATRALTASAARQAAAAPLRLRG